MSATNNYGQSFKTGIKNGKTPVAVVETIAKRVGKTPSYVWNQLKKQGFAYNVSFKGQNCWFPTFKPTGNAKGWKTCESQCWENVIQFAIYKGWVTPEQLNNWNNTQIAWYVSNCFSNFYNKPAGFNPNAAKWNAPGPWTPTKSTKTKSKRKTRTASKPKTKSARKSTSKRRKTYGGMRLVGGTSARKSTGRTRRYTSRKAA